MNSFVKGAKNFAILFENNLVLRTSQQNLAKRGVGFFATRGGTYCSSSWSSRSSFFFLHQSTVPSTWWCGPRPRLGWVEMAVGLPEGPSYPGHSSFIFSLCCSLNDRRRAAHSIFEIGRLFSLFLLLPYSCPPSSPHSSSSPDER